MYLLKVIAVEDTALVQVWKERSMRALTGRGRETKAERETETGIKIEIGIEREAEIERGIEIERGEGRGRRRKDLERR